MNLTNGETFGVVFVLILTETG